MQESPLYRILVAYANVDQEIGYTQGKLTCYFNIIGMNFLAVTLFEILNDEYDAFLGMMYIMRTLNWRCMYLHNTPKLQNLLLLI